MNPTKFPKSNGGRHRRARGFTLVEVMVAASAGLVVAAAAFMLSKNAMNLFQHEARVSAAQMSATLGMSRLAADVQRAGYMVTANIDNDPRVCHPGGVAPDPLFSNLGFRIQAFRIQQGGSVGAPQSRHAINGMNPDSIEIMGNFASAEQFPVRSVNYDPGAPTAPLDITLQLDSGAMTRTLLRASSGGGGLADIFRGGRMLRFVDQDGRESYGVILSTAVAGPANAPTSVVITLAGAPMPSLPSQDNCGVAGFATGAMVNPVARIRYDLRSLAGDADYGLLVGTDFAGANAAGDAERALMSGDAGRTELVREELDINGNPLFTLDINGDPVDTIELVAEYAVDLKFGITMACATSSPALVSPCNDAFINEEPKLIRAAIDDTAGEDPSITTRWQAEAGGSNPERVRSIQIRLATRGRSPDRKYPITGPTDDDGRRTRFYIPGVPGETDLLGGEDETLNWVRMRTIYTEVQLNNLSSIRW